MFNLYRKLSKKKKQFAKKFKNAANCRSVPDLGMGESVTHPALRDSTPYRPKASPFVLFWLTDYEIFLKALSAPIYTNFEGDRAPN